MTQTKILAIRRELAADLVMFVLLLCIAIVAPLIRQQAITGTIVNAVLFVSAVSLGIRGAVLIALVPSIFSLSVGLLPALLAPMVPFIMIGNIILILVFDFLRKRNYWLGIVSGSFLKFIFLASVSSVVINLLLKKEIAPQVATMMSWPQLLTALAGGAVAYLVLRGLNRSDVK
jgi:hypothetical protein